MIGSIALDDEAAALLRAMAEACKEKTGRDATMFQARAVLDFVKLPYQEAELSAFLPAGVELATFTRGGDA